MNDSTHIRLIEFLSSALDIFQETLKVSKYERTYRTGSFQIALIARIRDRADAVLTLLREDRDHSIAELVRAVLEAHAALHFLMAERKAIFRLELESLEDSINMLKRTLALPGLSQDEQSKGERSLAKRERRSKLLLAKGIRTLKKSDRIVALGANFRVGYSILSSESHHGLDSLSDRHFDTSNGYLQITGGERHQDRTLVIYVAIVLEAITAAMHVYATKLARSDFRSMLNGKQRDIEQLLLDYDAWGATVAQ